MLEELGKFKTFHPPGHYYSPIPDKEYVRKNAKRIFDRTKKDLPGIDLREHQQFELIELFRVFYDEIYFTDEKTAANRYFYKNGLFLTLMLFFAFVYLSFFSKTNN